MFLTFYKKQVIYLTKDHIKLYWKMAIKIAWCKKCFKILDETFVESIDIFGFGNVSKHQGFISLNTTTEALIISDNHLKNYLEKIFCENTVLRFCKLKGISITFCGADDTFCFRSWSFIVVQDYTKEKQNTFILLQP